MKAIKLFLIFGLVLARTLFAAGGEHVITESIAATVSGEVVFQSELKQYAGTPYADSALQKLIEQKVLYLLGKQNGLEATDAEIENVLSSDIDRMKRYYGGDALFNEVLNKMGYTLEAFIQEKRQEIKEQMIALKMFQQESYLLKKDIVISRNEVISFFDKNKQNFMKSEQRQISYILVKSSSPDDASAKKKINKIYKKLEAGASFAEIAKKYSDAPSASDGGAISGYITKGTLMKEMDRVAFSLNLNEFSKPFYTPVGYQIILVRDIVSGSLNDIKKPEVFNRVRESYINSLVQKEYYKWLKSEMDKMDIEILKN